MNSWLRSTVARWLRQFLDMPDTQRFVCQRGDSSVFYPTAHVVNSSGNPVDVTVGRHTHVRGELLTFGHGGRISIGDFCYVGEGTRIWSARAITVGDRVLISHNVNIFDNDTHPIASPPARHSQFQDIIEGRATLDIDLNEAPVLIGDDVLIGCQSIIISGINVGKGAVVGAGSVVTKDVPPYTIVAGNPARVVRVLKEAS